MANRTRTQVKQADIVDVYMLVKDEYIKKSLSDVEFADYAAEKLGFKIAASTIGQARKKYGIPPSKLARMNLNGRNGLLSPEEYIKVELLWEIMAQRHPEILKEFSERMSTYRQLKAMQDAESGEAEHPVLRVVGQGE